MGHFKSLFQNSLLLLFSFILVDYSRNYFRFAICHPMYFICVLYITYTITQLKIKCMSIVMYVCEWVQGMCTPQCVWGEQAITSNVPFDFLFGPGSLVVWNCIGQDRWPTSFWRVSCPSSQFLIGVLALQYACHHVQLYVGSRIWTWDFTFTRQLIPLPAESSPSTNMFYFLGVDIKN